MVHLIYKTDVHHSYASRALIGVAMEAFTALGIILEQAQKEGEDLSDEDAANLINIKQTQGYKGEGEFQYEEVETDILL
jgi:hypothetical protein